MTYEIALKCFEIILDWIDIVSSAEPERNIGMQVDENAVASFTLGCDKNFDILPTDDTTECLLVDYYKKYLGESFMHVSYMKYASVVYVGDDMLYLLVCYVGKDWVHGHICYQYNRSTGKSMYLCARARVWKGDYGDLDVFPRILNFLYRRISSSDRGDYFDHYNRDLQCLLKLRKSV